VGALSSDQLKGAVIEQSRPPAEGALAPLAELGVRIGWLCVRSQWVGVRNRAILPKKIYAGVECRGPPMAGPPPVG
jgi:hypothetical protein